MPRQRLNDFPACMLRRIQSRATYDSWMVNASKPTIQTTACVYVSEGHTVTPGCGSLIRAIAWARSTTADTTISQVIEADSRPAAADEHHQDLQHLPLSPSSLASHDDASSQPESHQNRTSVHLGAPRRARKTTNALVATLIYCAKSDLENRIRCPLPDVHRQRTHTKR